ncbi:2OG-Fe(II) oxygenase [Bradyrhizobium sp. CCGB12]|uniref:2OG-Fe(II) oxygenase n=1 Tax=Bradyrhizobium sp. CCGB12 TaxID=2949632 RepID=UPI0020B32D54|nr:2OG-Fe(II) oxygenase [Bradyrhizobium sp. CCGB12]MCP3390675.1 2OG-Fe(II) oxygenase [Bradyrhizobium sp. CCGB12]
MVKLEGTPSTERRIQKDQQDMTTTSPLSVGEPAPWFSAATDRSSASTVAFDELAGRYIVLFFMGSAARPDAVEVLATLARRDNLLDHEHALLLGISSDPNDFEQERARQWPPGQLLLWDQNSMIAKKYGVTEPAAGPPATIRPAAFILSPTLQIIEILPLTEPAAFVERIVSRLTELLAKPPLAQNAPVLVVPQVFDRAFCRRLIDLYDVTGGREIGLIENQGKILERTDTNFRKRLDYYISDQPTLQQTRDLLQRRLLPIVYRAFQFNTTRIERYLVGCYDAATGGYFRPHRDNTSPVVAHRRFAVTINLNEDYEGGNLRFPEFGHQTFRAPPGDAIVFSCSLLHEVTSVTRDRRYVFLSFLYDEASQQLRDAYRKTLDASQAS